MAGPTNFPVDKEQVGLLGRIGSRIGGLLGGAEENALFNLGLNLLVQGGTPTQFPRGFGSIVASAAQDTQALARQRKTESLQSDLIRARTRQLTAPANPLTDELTRARIGAAERSNRQTAAFLSPSGKEAADRRRIVEAGNLEELRRFDEDATGVKTVAGLRSTAGKEAEDRAALVKKFGDESVEVARFDAATAPRPGITVFDDEGNPIVTTGPAAGIASAAQRDRNQAQLDSITQARSILGNVRASIVADPTRAGAVGTVKKLTQRGIGILKDAVGITDADLPAFIQDSVSSVLSDLNAGLADPDVADFFDPALPRNDVFENAVAYGLARARKGSGRLNREDVINARKDVKFTGLKSKDEVLASIDAINAELNTSQRDIERRLGRGKVFRLNADGTGLEEIQ